MWCCKFINFLRGGNFKLMDCGVFAMNIYPFSVTLLAVACETAVEVSDEAVDAAQRAVLEGWTVRGNSYHCGS